MEGVEDIPAAVLDHGLGWDWQSFPEYLDALDAAPHAIDVARAGAPRRAPCLRHGARGIDHAEVPTEAEIELMGRISRRRRSWPARVGFTTSRSRNHIASDGRLTPSLSATDAELLGIAERDRPHRQGCVRDQRRDRRRGRDLALMRRICEVSGRPLSVGAAAAPRPAGGHLPARPRGLRSRRRATGCVMRGQAAARPTGLLMSRGGSVNPMARRRRSSRCATADRRAELQRADVRARILGELTGDADMMARFPLAYELGDPPRYDRDRSESLDARRGRGRRDATMELAYDIVAAGGIIYVPVSNFVDGDLERVHEMLVHPLTVPGLSDGGAHCTMIGDFDFPTFLVSYWGRERRWSSACRWSAVVKRQSADTAALVGLGDRGMLAPGLRADVNLIDFASLGSTAPDARRRPAR